jgi:iron(III) transport system substrate-binding protein
MALAAQPPAITIHAQLEEPLMKRRDALMLAGGLAALPLAASRAQSRQVVAYTAFADAATALAGPFRQRTGIEISQVAAGSGEVVRRIVAERARPLADCVLSVGGDSVDANPGVFTAYTPREDSAILPAMKASANWIPFSLTIPTVLIVNTRLVPAAEIPDSWRALADPKWRGRIAFAGADRSGSALQQMMQIIHNFGEDEGWRLFEAMLANFVITGSSGSVPRGVAQGEYAIGLTLEDFALRFLVGGSPVRIVYPREGITLAADAMALVANGPNPDAGRALLDFTVSAEAQRLLVERFGRRPIRGDVDGPAGLPAASALPINNVPNDWSVPRQREYLARYNRLVRR